MSVGEDFSIVSEARDTERAVAVWREKAARVGGIPSITAFDFTRISSDLGYRFVISSDEIVEDGTFILYGAQFARRLGLPSKVDSFNPVLRQLPERYHRLFREGCIEAIHERGPARFNGTVDNGVSLELYRSVFIPVKLREESRRPLIYGSFNFRTVRQVSAMTDRVLEGSNPLKTPYGDELAL